MEFDVRKVPNIKKEGRDRGSTRKRIRISATPDEKYPHNLTFYLDPPTDSISLQEFEEYALARLTCNAQCNNLVPCQIYKFIKSFHSTSCDRACESNIKDKVF